MFVGQLGDYIVEFLTLDSDKLIQVDENRIFIRVPTPQLQFLQILGIVFLYFFGKLIVHFRYLFP